MSAAYPAPSVISNARLRPPSASSAESLVLVGLILQVIGGVILLGAIAWLTGFSILNPFPYWWAAVSAALGVGVVVLVFLYLAYTLSYLRIRGGEFEAAQTPTLVIGILSLFAGVLPGIFYLIGYVKLGDAVREQSSSTTPSGYSPSGTAMAPMVACRGCGRVHPFGAYAFCPACGQKLGN